MYLGKGHLGVKHKLEDEPAFAFSTVNTLNISSPRMGMENVNSYRKLQK